MKVKFFFDFYLVYKYVCLKIKIQNVLEKFHVKTLSTSKSVSWSKLQKTIKNDVLEIALDELIKPMRP